ncbi:hypothetical protein D3C80_1321150 [compost metagenome]
MHQVTRFGIYITLFLHVLHFRFSYLICSRILDLVVPVILSPHSPYQTQPAFETVVQHPVPGLVIVLSCIVIIIKIRRIIEHITQWIVKINVPLLYRFVAVVKTCRCANR